MVSEILPTGAANAVPGKQLAEFLGLDHRALTRMIEKERQNGEPICAAVAGDSLGYYLPQDSSELSLYCCSLDRRLRNIQKTRRAVGDALAKMLEREEIDWGD